jgi:hypothetical protein
MRNKRRVVIEFNMLPPRCGEFSGWYSANALGWGETLVGMSRSIEELAGYLEQRFGTSNLCVAVGETINPRNWPEAAW